MCYVFPDLQHQTYVPLAKRFVASYMEHPPGDYDHELQVLVTFGRENQVADYAKLFSPLPCKFRMTDNVGKDIGAYQDAAEQCTADLMVCLGAPVHFYRAGWLDRLVHVYENLGPGLYGCRAYIDPMPHVRTTSFWLPPALLRSYPFNVSNSNRYEFEHGPHSIAMHTRAMGMQCYMVTFAGCYPMSEWGSTPPGNNLMLDQWSDRAGEKQ